MSNEHDIDWDAIAAHSGPVGVDRLRRILRTYQRSLEPPRTTSASGQSWNGLLLGEMLGRGSFGAVYAAVEPDLQREVAVKLFDDASLASRTWLGEARLLAGVRHPHVVAVYGANIEQGRAGIWMERVPGRTLAAALERDVHLPAVAVLDLARQLASALQAIHARGLVHGDLKPSNVMLEPGGRAVLLDFGAAWRSSEATLQAVASPQTSAPEVLDGREAGPAADLYSLGVLLYRCLGGAYPFPPDSLDALRDAQRRPADLIRLPKDWRKLVGSLLDPDATARPDAGAVALALLRIEQAPARRRVTRLQAGIAAALLLTLVVTVGGFVVQREAREQAEAAAAEATRQAERTKASLAVLQQQIGAAVRGPRGRATTVVDMLENVATQLAEGSPPDPFVRATLNYQLGVSFIDLGQPERGLDFLRDSIALLDVMRPPDEQAEALVRFKLGSTLCQSKPAVAVEQADALARLTLPLARLNEAKLRACAAQREGDTQAAETYLRRAIALAPDLGARDSYDWGLWQRLGELLRNRGALDEAAKLMAEAEAGLIERYGQTHRIALSAGRNYATVLLDLGQYAPALERLEREIADEEKRLGRQSPGWVISADTLATAYARAGRPGQALALQEQALAAVDSAFPPAHLALIQVRHNLVARRFEAGDPTGALALSDEVESSAISTLGQAHPVTLMVILRRIEIDMDQDRTSDARRRLALIAEAVARLEEDHPFRHYALLWSAELASRSGELDTAQQHFDALAKLDVRDAELRVQQAFRQALHTARIAGASPAQPLQAVVTTSRSTLGPGHPLTRRIERAMAADKDRSAVLPRE